MRAWSRRFRRSWGVILRHSRILLGFEVFKPRPERVPLGFERADLLSLGLNPIDQRRDEFIANRR